MTRLYGPPGSRFLPDCRLYPILNYYGCRKDKSDKRLP